MASSLPQLLANYITHNRIYGLAVFCRKDPENREPRVGDGAVQEWGGERRGGGDGARRGGAQENFNDDGEIFAWENDLDSEDERYSARRSISVALVEGNCMSHNGGKLGHYEGSIPATPVCWPLASDRLKSFLTPLLSFPYIMSSCRPVREDQ